jgi:hypothetical protein
VKDPPQNCASALRVYTPSRHRKRKLKWIRIEETRQKERSNQYDDDFFFNFAMELSSEEDVELIQWNITRVWSLPNWKLFPPLSKTVGSAFLMQWIDAEEGSRVL